jgi:hemolysin III
MAYTVGAIIYAVERPNPLPGRFGHHGLWHLLVLAGSACHFTFIALYVAAI